MGRSFDYPVALGYSCRMNLLKTEDAAEYLGISPTRLKQIIAGGRYALQPVLRGKPNWYSTDDLDAFKKLARPHGNPEFGPDFHKPKTKPRKRLRKTGKK